MKKLRRYLTNALLLATGVGTGTAIYHYGLATGFAALVAGALITVIVVAPFTLKNEEVEA